MKFKRKIYPNLLKILMVVLVGAASLRFSASSSAHADPPIFLPLILKNASGPSAIPNFSHIFIIIMENTEANRIVANPDAPYFNSLITRYASTTNYYGIRHPSLPNYLALTGGDTFGITDDCMDCFINRDNLVNQLEVAGRSWKAYMESMPRPCLVGDAGLYAQRHNPFIYYDNIRTDPVRCQKIVPFDQFATDLATNALPDFVWITPNVCHDLHDCQLSEGDNWLQTWVPQILASPAWQNNGVLFITFDEGTSNAGCCTYATGGKIETLVISLLVQPGFKSAVAYNHYSLLHTIETAWNLPLLGQAGCDCSAPMDDFFDPKISLAAGSPGLNNAH